MQTTESGTTSGKGVVSGGTVLPVAPPLLPASWGAVFMNRPGAVLKIRLLPVSGDGVGGTETVGALLIPPASRKVSIPDRAGAMMVVPFPATIMKQRILGGVGAVKVAPFPGASEKKVVSGWTRLVVTLLFPCIIGEGKI